jgi:antitoxin (DNA-binding transcriptional repressor) of toxin-antitoxin stability system
MKTATVRQIRNAFPAVLRLIRNGESVAITSRRKVVATLTPPVRKKAARRSRPWADLDLRLAELRQQPMLPLSGAELIAQDRERY